MNLFHLKQACVLIKACRVAHQSSFSKAQHIRSNSIALNSSKLDRSRTFLSVTSIRRSLPASRIYCPESNISTLWGEPLTVADRVSIQDFTAWRYSSFPMPLIPVQRTFMAVFQ